LTAKTWLPHRAPRSEQRFIGAVRQIVGGRRWSLCLITQIEPTGKSEIASRTDQESGKQQDHG
jgi:hypothetical protein